MNTVLKPKTRRPRCQRGAALLVSLVILIAMTLIGLTATRTTTLQERMAGNMRDKAIALEAAEDALRQGEAWVNTNMTNVRPIGNAVAPSACATAPCPLQQGNLDPRAPATWNTANGVAQVATPMAGTSASAQYYVEYLQFVRAKPGTGATGGQAFYRITARGQGPTGDAVAIVQSTWVVAF